MCVCICARRSCYKCVHLSLFSQHKSFSLLFNYLGFTGIACVMSTHYTSVALTRWRFFPSSSSSFFFISYTTHCMKARTCFPSVHSHSLILLAGKTSCIIDFQFVFYTVDGCANLHDQECCKIKYSRLSKLPGEVCVGSKTHITREQSKQ